MNIERQPLGIGYHGILLDPEAETQGSSTPAVDAGTQAFFDSREVESDNGHSVGEELMGQPDWDAEAAKGKEGAKVEKQVDTKDSTEKKTEEQPKKSARESFLDQKSKPNYMPETTLEKEAREAKEKLNKEENGNSQEQTGNKDKVKRTESKPSDQSDKQTIDTKATDPISIRFPTAEVFLKKMAPDAREYVKARFNEVLAKEAEIAEKNKVIETIQAGRTPIPQSYYENPNAYLLDPSFHQATQRAALAEQVQNHWRIQHRAILSGEDWYDLEAVKDAKGNTVGFQPSKTPTKASGSAQADVEEWLSDAKVQLGRELNQRNAIVQNFSKQVQTIQQQIKQAETELFPPEKWDKQDSAEAKLVENVKAGIRQLGATEANPLFPLLAKTGAALIQMKEYLASQGAKQDVTKKIEANTRKAGPTAEALKSGGGGASLEKELGNNVADFKKLRPQSRYS